MIGKQSLQTILIIQLGPFWSARWGQGVLYTELT